MAVQARRIDAGGSVPRFRDRGQKVRIDGREAVCPHSQSSYPRITVPDASIRVCRELEKATTRTYDREKPYSSKTARKVLYEKVSTCVSPKVAPR